MFSLPPGRRRPRTVHRPALALIVVIVLIIAGCSSAEDEATATAAGAAATTVDSVEGADDATTPPTESEPEPEPTPADVLPPETFEGQATTVSGETFELSGLAGQDLILWFWAPW